MSYEDVRAVQQERAAPQGAVELYVDWLCGPVTGRLPKGWKLVQPGADGGAWVGRIAGQPLVVIWSLAYEADGALWLHVSASHRSRVPTWAEMCAVKELFIGPDRWAVQLHPPATEHINIHPLCLHLFAPFSPEAWPLPDFAAGLGTI
jgi:hypothetical protein